MKHILFVFLAVLAAATAMVPRERRAIVTDEEVAHASSVPTTTGQICAKQTPCAWSMYSLRTKKIDFNITNTYCICGTDTVCVVAEDDPTVNAFVHKCQTPTDSES